MLHAFPGAWAPARFRTNRSTSAANWLNDGTHTTPSTAHTWGTPTQLIASTPWDTVAVGLRVATGVNSSGARSDSLLEILVGGSGSETSLIGPVLWGGRPSGTIMLPCFVPAGSRLSWRVKSARTSLAMNATCELYGSPNAHTMGLPTRWVPYGLANDSSSASWGTAVTAGGQAFGSWTSLTTSTTYPHSLWMPMVDIGTAVVTALCNYRSQFACASTTDAATMATNGTAWDGPMWQLSATEQNVSQVTYSAAMLGLPFSSEGIFYAPRPAGSAVSVRAAASVASPPSNGCGAAILGAVM